MTANRRSAACRRSRAGKSSLTSDTLTESSEFLITLFSGFAQAESESLSKNVTWGKQKSAEAGKVPFQYKKMLGYRKGADGEPEIVPEEADIVRRIYQRYLRGCTLGQIKKELEQENVPAAQKVGQWSHAVIRNILTNEKYIGDALLQKTYITDCITKKVKKNQGERPMYYVENNPPAIIPRETFDRVQAEMTRRSSKRKVLQKRGRTELGKYSGKFALTELLVCGECGSPYKRVTWARNGTKRIVWRCVSRLEFGTKCCHNSPTLDEGKLHQAIFAAVNESISIMRFCASKMNNIGICVHDSSNLFGCALLLLPGHMRILSCGKICISLSTLHSACGQWFVFLIPIVVQVLCMIIIYFCGQSNAASFSSTQDRSCCQKMQHRKTLHEKAAFSRFMRICEPEKSRKM